MRTVLTTMFFLASLFAAISVAALMTEEASATDAYLAVASVLVAALIYVGRHFYLIRFGRLGLLKPSLFWKPLTPKQRKAYVAVSSAGTIQTVLSHAHQMKATGGVEPDTVYWLEYSERRKIKALGYDRKMRSDEELTSESKLIRFVECSRKDRSKPPMEELRGVRDTAVFFALRQKIDDWYARREADKDTYQEWLAEVGTVDQSHLLKDGWIPFLQSLRGPDIHLWHGVATDFHEMFGDRLEAAFWIVEQEACDKATVSDFIQGYILHELSAEYADISRLDRRLERFAAVIEAYNSGAFAAHSITAGTHLMEPLGEAEAARLLSIYEEKHGLPALPRPRGLIDQTVVPTSPPDRGYKSPYAFWDDAGLHLEYPGANWRKAG